LTAFECHDDSKRAGRGLYDEGTPSISPHEEDAMSYYGTFESPVGAVYIGGSDEGIHRVDFVGDADEEARFLVRLERDSGSAPREDSSAAGSAVEQLRTYFAGERFAFEMPLAPKGTAFQQTVWMALRDIPYGSTTSYGAIAQKIGRPSASRAVGMANGRNPLGIVVPCHRVIGSSGALTGYGGGLHRKEWLLAHEARAPLCEG
jgi:methylated-DNA-[protein]-cysteine S-methyltransferase